jgi:hypothetical protein
MISENDFPEANMEASPQSYSQNQQYKTMNDNNHLDGDPR